MTSPTYSLREMENIIRKNNYHLKRVKGSHKIYKNEQGATLVLAVSNSNKMIFQRIIKEHHLMV